jgi:uncharacterized membrane protein (GlpM family)
VNGIFALRVFLSFLVGGSFVVILIRASKLFSYRIAAAIMSTPTTVFVGLIFLTWQEGVQATRNILPQLIIFILCSVLFAYLFSFGNKHRAYRSRLLAGLLGWLVAATVAAVSTRGINIFNAVILGCLFLVGFHLLFISTFHMKSTRIKAAPEHLLYRFFASGILMSIAVISAKLLGSFFGFIASTLPVMYTLSLSFILKDQGVDYLHNLVCTIPKMVVSILIFQVSLWWLLAIYDPYIAFLGAWLLSLCYAVIISRTLAPAK